METLKNTLQQQCDVCGTKVSPLRVHTRYEHANSAEKNKAMTGAVAVVDHDAVEDAGEHGLQQAAGGNMELENMLREEEFQEVESLKEELLQRDTRAREAFPNLYDVTSVVEDAEQQTSEELRYEQMGKVELQQRLAALEEVIESTWSSQAQILQAVVEKDQLAHRLRELEAVVLLNLSELADSEKKKEKNG